MEKQTCTVSPLNSFSEKNLELAADAGVQFDASKALVNCLRTHYRDKLRLNDSFNTRKSQQTVGDFVKNPRPYNYKIRSQNA